jgi:hypothetical protein
VRIPCAANAAEYLAISSPCPTLAAACWVARSDGRRLRRSGTSPAAIAPDDTRTRCVFPSAFPASAAVRATILFSSIAPWAVVREEDPILTTTLRAAAMSGLAGEPSVAPPRLIAGYPFRAGWGHGR